MGVITVSRRYRARARAGAYTYAGVRIWITAGILLLFSIPVFPGGGALTYAEENSTFQIADNLYARRCEAPENSRRMMEIIEEKLAADEQNPGNYELLWRAARGYLFLGDYAGESKEKLRLYEKGKEYAELAVAANSQGYEGFFYLGVLIGSIGEERGVMNSLFMVKPMRNALERCLEIDPERPLAYNPLAQLYWKAPGRPLSIGNIKTALQLAEKLVTLSPDSPYDWYIYGCIALATKERDLAMEAFTKCLSFPEDPEDPRLDREAKESARAELDKLKK